MILLDTHIFVWLVNNDNHLDLKIRKIVEAGEDEIAISLISIWEIAKLSEKGRLILNQDTNSWINKAVESTGVLVIPLDIPIIVNSTSLPGDFHKDPADQLIVATARVMGIPLLTMDEKIMHYSSVNLFEI